MIQGPGLYQINHNTSTYVCLTLMLAIQWYPMSLGGICEVADGWFKWASASILGVNLTAIDNGTVWSGFHIHAVSMAFFFNNTSWKIRCLAKAANSLKR